MEKIVPGKHVSLIYDLYTIDDMGNEILVHQSDPADAEKIIFGVTQGVIVPLEEALDGLTKGAEFNVVAKPEQAFGEHVVEQVVELDKDMFLVDGKFDTNIVKEGNYVPMMTADGYRINGLVLEITGDKVKLDFNHPLAGKTVRFKGSVLDVRDATEDEIHLATAGGCGGCGCHKGEGEGCCHSEEEDCSCSEGCCCNGKD